MIHKNWYKIKQASPFGTEPFGKGDLSDKVRVDPYGHVGGDSRTGVFEESWGKHDPNDYFSESDNTPTIERRLQEKKRKLQKNLKRKLKKKKSNWDYDLIKESQWGVGGPKIPIWQDDNWVMKTYKEIANPRTRKSPVMPKRKKIRPRRRRTGLDFSTVSIENEKEDNPYKKALRGSVSIRSYADDSFEIGSGFFINSNMVVTCFHVSSPGGKEEDIKIRYNEKDFSAVILTSDPKIDVSVLVVNDPLFQSANFFTLGKSSNVKQGDSIIIVGTPLGFENIVGEGIVSTSGNVTMEMTDILDFSEDNNEIPLNIPHMFMTANISPGNSGGPVIDKEKNVVIGMAAAVISIPESQGLNAAIPIDIIKNFLNKNRIKFFEE